MIKIRLVFLNPQHLKNKMIKKLGSNIHSLNDNKENLDDDSFYNKFKIKGNPSKSSNSEYKQGTNAFAN